MLSSYAFGLGGGVCETYLLIWWEGGEYFMNMINYTK